MRVSRVDIVVDQENNNQDEGGGKGFTELITSKICILSLNKLFINQNQIYSSFCKHFILCHTQYFVLCVINRIFLLCIL